MWQATQCEVAQVALRALFVRLKLDVFLPLEDDMTGKIRSSGVSFPRHALLQFINEGCAHFPYKGTPLCEMATPVFDRFKTFLRQDEARLARFTVFVDREGNTDPDDGYIRPGLRPDGTVDASKDRKRYFHYREDLRARLPRDLTLNNVERRFLLSTARLFAHALAIEREFAGALENAFPEYPFLRGVTSKRASELHVLRLLAYDPSGDGGVLAKPHYDRDFATLHIHETAPGLFHGEEGSEVAYRSAKDKIFMFAGDKAQVFTGGIPDWDLYEKTGQKVIRGGRVFPRRHVVRPVGVGTVRCSAVFFGHINTSERDCALPWK